MGNNYIDRRGLYPDKAIVDCYLKHMSQIKAAAELGIHRNTVARAVQRAGIPLTGRTYNGHQERNASTKILDDQLIEAAKTMSATEIAVMYDMSEEQVCRRAKKLGIPLAYTWEGGHWKKRAKRYRCVEFDDAITLKSVYQRDRGICQICGKPTDLQDVINGHIRKLYPSVDHIIPLSKGGAHTWENVRLAHMACNAGKRDKVV